MLTVQSWTPLDAWTFTLKGRVPPLCSWPSFYDAQLQELEKKRHEERMRQKLWEQKHRLGSFRRRTRLPAALMDADQVAPQEEERDRARLPLSPLPSGLAARRPSIGDYTMRDTGGERTVVWGKMARSHKCTPSRLQLLKASSLNAQLDTTQ